MSHRPIASRLFSRATPFLHVVNEHRWSATYFLAKSGLYSGVGGLFYLEPGLEPAEPFRAE